MTKLHIKLNGYQSLEKMLAAFIISDITFRNKNVRSLSSDSVITLINLRNTNLSVKELICGAKYRHTPIWQRAKLVGELEPYYKPYQQLVKFVEIQLRRTGEVY